MSVSSKSTLEQFQDSIKQRFPSLQTSSCWKLSRNLDERKTPFLVIYNPRQKPNLRLMSHLPSFYVIARVVEDDNEDEKDDGTNQSIEMCLTTYQGKEIAKESVNLKPISRPKFRLLSHLANHCIGEKICWWLL